MAAFSTVSENTARGLCTTSIFTSPRDGGAHHTNEDVVCDYETSNGNLLAVIDGITPLTDWRGTVDGDTISAGRLAALVVRDSLPFIKLQTNFEDFLEIVVTNWNKVRGDYGVPDEDIIGAVFCIYVPWLDKNGQLWSFGDCNWGYQTTNGTWVDSLGGTMPGNSDDAETRAKVILARMKELGVEYPQDVVANADLAKELALLGAKAARSNRLAKGPSYHAWMQDPEGIKTHNHARPVVEVPKGIHTLVLSTDGTLVVPRSIGEAQAFLKELREVDPLMIGRNRYNLRTAKGFVCKHTGAVLPFTDDLGIIEATFRYA